MLMRPDNGAIDKVAVPIQVSPRIRLLLEGRQDPIPDARFLPAVEATGYGLPGAVALGQITPGSTGLENPQDAIDDPPVVMVRATDLRFVWWEKLLQALPLRFG
jgi:hypothetical protein